MELSDFTRQRKFEQPYAKTRREIGVMSMLWALLFGPIYYWRQGAMIEGILFALATIPVFFIDEDSSTISIPLLEGLTMAIWIASVVLAPVLLAASYRRRGWVEITDDER
jgi:hypothetical protein